MRIYIDGIFDLFHRGHIEILKKAKNYRKNATLIVGLISDENAKNYKRLPIYNQEDRYMFLESNKYVDEIIFDSPLIITSEFVKKHNIDIILHSFADANDSNKQDEFFKQVIDIFHIIPYYPNLSTTEIISKIKNL
jgi:choline-phosphate cytidylyltransferase